MDQNTTAGTFRRNQLCSRQDLTVIAIAIVNSTERWRLTCSWVVVFLVAAAAAAPHLSPRALTALVDLFLYFFYLVVVVVIAVLGLFLLVVVVLLA